MKEKKLKIVKENKKTERKSPSFSVNFNLVLWHVSAHVLDPNLDFYLSLLIWIHILLYSTNLDPHHC